MESYTKTELNFAQKHPELIGNDFMLKPLAYIVENDIDKTNWKLFEAKTHDILKQFFEGID